MVEKVSPKHGTFGRSVQFCFLFLLQKQEGNEGEGGRKMEKEKEVEKVEKGKRFSTDNMQ